MMIAITVKELFVILLFSIHHGHFLLDCLQVCWAPIVNYEIDISWPNTSASQLTSSDFAVLFCSAQQEQELLWLW